MHFSSQMDLIYKNPKDRFTVIPDIYARERVGDVGGLYLKQTTALFSSAGRNRRGSVV